MGTEIVTGLGISCDDYHLSVSNKRIPLIFLKLETFRYATVNRSDVAKSVVGMSQLLWIILSCVILVTICK